MLAMYLAYRILFLHPLSEPDFDKPPCRFSYLCWNLTTVVERDNNRQDPGKDLSNSDSNRKNITAPDVASQAEKLFRRGARTVSQDLDRHFERLPLLVQ
jgi:hypothetical protein